MGKKDIKGGGSQKMTDFLLTFLNGFIQKFSMSLVLNAKKQVEDVIFKVKKGIFAGFFLLIGLFFVLIGLSIYLDSAIGTFAGAGYFVVGGSGLLLALLIAFLRK